MRPVQTLSARIIRLATVVIAATTLTSCSLGVSGGSSDDGGIAQAVATVEAQWLVVDMNTGAASAYSALPDLATNPAYRTNQLVFRRVTIASSVIGSAPGDRWAQDDEPRSAVALTSYFIAAFELTRGQWRHLSSSTPWLTVTPASLVGLADDDQLPVCGISLDQVQSACAAWGKPGHLSVPTAVQWEAACRAGTTTSFSWGEQTDETTVAQSAVVRQTAGGVDGPRPVGTRAANAFGLCDMHGNVWEWTTDGGLRGGSWNDGLPLARSANHIALDRATSHALAGARLTYAP